MKTLIAFIIILGISTVVLANMRLSFGAPPASAEDATATYLGNYVTRVEDKEKKVICYRTGPSGISCLKSF